jgi:hypothetical protein
MIIGGISVEFRIRTPNQHFESARCYKSGYVITSRQVNDIAGFIIENHGGTDASGDNGVSRLHI